MRILMTGGGTGGHVNPALAIADAFRMKHSDCSIEFVGAVLGIENDLVPRAGYKLHTIDIEGLTRSFKPGDILSNAKALTKAAASLSRAKQIIRDFRPDCVVGTGGYAGFSAVYAGQKMGIPTAILEVNAHPGLTSRILAKKADRVLVCFEESANSLKRKHNVVFTGVPVRPGLLLVDRERAREKYGLASGERFVLSFWGSMGAQYMNEHMVDFIDLETKTGSFAHLHAMGKRASEWMPGRLAKRKVNLEKHPGIRLVEYIYDMPDAMAAADLVICRAGAATMGEICFLGKPSILVPSPFVAENHQEKNARALEAQGGCIVLTERECTGAKLLGLARDILNNEKRKKSLAEQAKKMTKPDSLDRIYQNIMELM